MAKTRRPVQHAPPHDGDPGPANPRPGIPRRLTSELQYPLQCSCFSCHNQVILVLNKFRDFDVWHHRLLMGANTMRQWTKPTFEPFDANAECTAYAGAEDARAFSRKSASVGRREAPAMEPTAEIFMRGLPPSCANR